MTIPRLSGGELLTLQSIRERLLRALFATTIGILTLASPVASAQIADSLTAQIAKDAACTSPEARTRLQDNIAKAGAAPAELLAALNAIAADTAACAPVRAAATELAITLAPAPVVAPDDIITAASNMVVADTLAEAERRASNMKFEVGPPPPRLTRGRSAGL